MAKPGWLIVSIGFVAVPRVSLSSVVEGQRAPFALLGNLTKDEKADLVAFLRAL
jgi:hypothetical protein